MAALGAGVASANNLLDVDAIILGGGLGTRFGQPSADRLAREMLPHLFVRTGRRRSRWRRSATSAARSALR